MAKPAALRIFSPTGEARQAWMPGVVALEALATYPLGDRRFRIDHGANYFAFFERLGSLDYQLAVEGGEVLAVGAGVLRRVPFAEGQAPQATWYLADLKVHPKARGRHLPLRLLGKGLWARHRKASCCYMISMDPPQGENRVVRLMGRFPLLPLRLATRLQIYAWDQAQALRAQPLLEALRGPTRYASLKGVKDLILVGDDAPMAVLHAQHGPCAAPGGPPQAGHTHFACAPAGDPLALALTAAGLHPSASASLIALGMGGSDWRFVLTSDI